VRRGHDNIMLVSLPRWNDSCKSYPVALTARIHGIKAPPKKMVSIDRIKKQESQIKTVPRDKGRYRLSWCNLIAQNHLSCDPPLKWMSLHNNFCLAVIFDWSTAWFGF
jgi:hypothetical protein